MIALAPPVLAAKFAAFLADLGERHRVWVVGGWVRDSLAGYTPHDADFATDAGAQAVQSICDAHGLRILWDKVAQQHGTYRIGLPHTQHVLDLATLRRDVGRLGTRHAQVAFTDDIHADLSRRDLTINGMAIRYPWQDNAQVLDPHAGQADLQARVLRFIGDPAQRIKEDPLRLLRVARFACLGDAWRIDANSEAALAGQAALLPQVSGERLQQEIWRSLTMQAPWRLWQVLQQAGACAAVVPNETNPNQLQVGIRWLRHSAALQQDAQTRLCAFVVGLSPQLQSDGGQAQAPLDTATYLRRLRFGKKQTVHITQAAKHFPWQADNLVDAALAQWLLQIGAPGWQTMQALLRCGMRAESAHSNSWQALQSRAADMLHGQSVPTLAALAVDGRTLAQQGIIPAGPATGQALHALLVWGLQYNRCQDTEGLLAYAAHWWSTTGNKPKLPTAR